MTDWEARYYEAEASHTEANGMLTAERDAARIARDAWNEKFQKQCDETDKMLGRAFHAEHENRELRAYAVALEATVRESAERFRRLAQLADSKMSYDLGTFGAERAEAVLAKSMDGAQPAREAGVEGFAQPAGGHSTEGGSPHSPPSTHLEFQSCTKSRGEKLSAIYDSIAATGFNLAGMRGTVLGALEDAAEVGRSECVHQVGREPSMTTLEIRSWLAPATGECLQQIENLLAHCAELESRHVAEKKP